MDPHLLPPDNSIGTLVTRVVDDTKSYVGAEVAVYRARALRWVGAAKIIAIFGFTALVLANAAIIALLVGLILTLQPLVGAGWATVIVVIGTLAVAGLLGWLASRQVQKMSIDKGAA